MFVNCSWKDSSYGYMQCLQSTSEFIHLVQSSMEKKLSGHSRIETEGTFVLPYRSLVTAHEYKNSLFSNDLPDVAKRFRLRWIARLCPVLPNQGRRYRSKASALAFVPHRRAGAYFLLKILLILCDPSGRLQWHVPCPNTGG